MNRRPKDFILLALWVCSYEIVLCIFGFIKRLEPKSKRGQSQVEPG